MHTYSTVPETACKYTGQEILNLKILMRTSCIRSPVSANLHSLIYWFNDKPDIIPGGRLKYDCFCWKTKMKNCVNLYWKLKLWRIQYFCLLKDEGPRWQTLQSNNYLGRCFWRLPAKMWRKLKPPLMQWVSILYYCVHHWQPMIYMQCSLHITIQEDYKYLQITASHMTTCSTSQ